MDALVAQIFDLLAVLEDEPELLTWDADRIAALERLQVGTKRVLRLVASEAVTLNPELEE